MRRQKVGEQSDKLTLRFNEQAYGGAEDKREGTEEMGRQTGALAGEDIERDIREKILARFNFSAHSNESFRTCCSYV